MFEGDLQGDNKLCDTSEEFEESEACFASTCRLRSVGWGLGTEREGGSLNVDGRGSALLTRRGVGGLGTGRGGGVGRRGSGSLGRLSGVRGPRRGGGSEERGGYRGGGGWYGGRP